jgi:hypothetical protein
VLILLGFFGGLQFPATGTSHPGIFHGMTARFQGSMNPRRDGEYALPQRVRLIRQRWYGPFGHRGCRSGNALTCPEKRFKWLIMSENSC